MEAGDQAIQIILMGLPEDIYAAVDSCETAQEIWLRVQQMMKGSDTGIQDKKAKLFNEWERFTSTDGESIESYYHHCTAGDEFRSRQIDADGWRNGNVVETRAEGDLEEIEEVNANCILMANLQQASTSGTQTDKAPVYDSDGSTELLEPISEPHQVQQNDSNVTSVVSSVEQSGGTVEQHPAIVEETHAYFESLYNNLAIEVEKVNTVNRKMKETNADLTTELARYKNQEKIFEIN
ncbi:hypothetical protein Tco_0157570 [Tanacetum coccineum]